MSVRGATSKDSLGSIPPSGKKEKPQSAYGPKLERCAFIVSSEGDSQVTCDKVVPVALRVIKCGCDKFYCREHFNAVAHVCCFESHATRSVVKTRFFQGSSNPLDGAC